MFALCTVSLYTASAWADLVHVVEQREVGGVTTVMRDETKITGMPWAPAPAPSVDGAIFTHWTISTQQDFAARDAWGRACDAPRFKLYEDTTLTAHYLPAMRDTDGDGVPDGYELYWYGNLDQDAASDTDGDGFTFAEEIANGTNPLMPENEVAGAIAYGDGALLLYNPSGYASVVVRSEPAVLFTASEEWLRPGTYVGTGTYSPTSSAFAYWTLNGVPVRDAWGRAVDRVELMMPTGAVELVAHTESNDNTRMKLYWYGRTDIAMDSDTDGDGFTFAEELANGTNPLMPDSTVEGPIAYADSELLQYNPYNLQPYTIRSDPEGALFETIHDYAPFGTFVNATQYAPNISTFACWVLNGVEQRDAWGRAVEVLSLQMSTNAQELVAKVIEDEAARLSYYWYGRTDVAMDSDTDGDGFTFAEEIANGTNPLMPDSAVEGPIAYADSDTLEANLQPFDPATGAVVDDTFDELFTSPFAGNGATSRTFGLNARPVVTDVNGDGLFDLVILYDGGYSVYLNGGTAGNPMFTRAEGVSTNGLDLAQGSLAALDGLTLDRNVALDLPQSATIEISDSHPLVPSLVAVHVADASVASETEFELPVTVTSTEVLTNFTAEVTWATALLEFRGVPPMSGDSDATRCVPPVLISTAGGDFVLKFYAKDQHTVTETVITLGSASAWCEDGLAAVVTCTDGRVFITDSNPPVAPNMTLGAWSVRVLSGEAFPPPGLALELDVCVRHPRNGAHG